MRIIFLPNYEFQSQRDAADDDFLNQFLVRKRFIDNFRPVDGSQHAKRY